MSLQLQSPDFEALILQFLSRSSQRWDAAHDPGHVRRVVHAATLLAGREGADLEIVVPAAWLHDCVHVPKDSPQRGEASRMCAKTAVEWLATRGYPARHLPEIAHAIEAHSFSAGIVPRTVAACVVQDADRLDALGAIGLSRCLMLGAEMGRPLFDPADPFLRKRQPDDSRWTVDHFYAKLLTLEGSMRTAAGREEARRRTRFLELYLRELARELGHDEPLPA